MTAPACAGDLGSDLKSFWERTGGGVNVTKPTAFQGQQAGYATLGSLYLRTQPRNSQLAAIQLPSIRAGCGGIDIFGGAFSFISEEEMVALMEAIMQNAASFAFELALESMSPTVQDLVSRLRHLIQQVNSANINSCEAGQLLAASLWPKMDGASQHICRTVGSYTGKFADRVATTHGCGTGGKFTETTNGATGALKDQVPTDVNYAWRAIKKNNFLTSNRAIAEFFMTLTGTVITRAGATDDDGPTHRTIPPRALSPEAAKALVEGGRYSTLVCDTVADCLNPVLKSKTIAGGDALFTVTATAIEELSDAISNDTAPPAAAIALINLTTVPIYDHLVTAKSYKYRFVQDDINSMAELVAVDLAMAYIDESVAEILKSASNVDIAGEINREFQKTVRETQNTLQDLRALAQGKYAEAMRNLERLSLAKEQLAATTNTVFGSTVINGGRDD
ncbi:conjugal transfer protein TraH [Chachezhania sediminis]|uniref:conjugal transfer protein TraH n=1 Tax=Chachezhania sediminis TaxID=2599291 RepID=UPI00131CB999|nr:conjugal transfer protein TraH [Chachezhania sediminis]